MASKESSVVPEIVLNGRFHLDAQPSRQHNISDGGVMARIFRLLLVVAAVILGVVWYFHWQKTRALNSGEVHVRQQPAAPSQAAPSQPNHPEEQASAEPNPPNSLPEEIATLPATDTLNRNPPSGVAAGTGRFELYRQGDITWRMDTASGEACVLFATEAQWHKEVVYQHGCNSR